MEGYVQILVSFYGGDVFKASKLHIIAQQLKSSIVVEGSLFLSLNLRDSLDEIFVSQLSATTSQSNHASLDTDCLKLSTVKLRSATGKLLEIHIILVNVHLAGMDLHDTGAGLFVGEWELDLTIKTTRTKESRIQNVRSVSSSNDLDTIILSETIKLVEELKHGSVHFTSFVFTAASLGAHCIKLINENDCWSLLSCKLESVSDHFCTITDKHLHKLWASKLQESCLGLSSASSCHHGLSSSWRTMHEEALGRTNTDSIEAVFVRHRQDNSFDKLLNLFV